MKATNVNCLRFFKDRLLPERIRSFQGRRVALTGKDGNKDFYKGTGSANMGRSNKHGKFMVDYYKVRTYVVPAGLDDTELTPYCNNSLRPVKNEFAGYRLGPYDGELYLEKYNEYETYGADESPRSALQTEKWIERG
ncbi:mitochondrial ribosomal protein L27-domain-containing protein [Lipomyces arxii]|uniref:mitochondrial 54S ribosomal protein mL41 n=1 Tax=Lipomyces arxii TaxID=56418 RepID=UPI0034CD2425